MPDSTAFAAKDNPPDPTLGHRRTKIVAILTLTAVVVAVVAGLVTRPAPRGPAVTATIEQLWRASDAYLDRAVATEGTLRVFAPGTAGEHYAVEQAGQYRVGLRGVPDARLRRLVDQAVAVEGELRFGRDVGLFIQVERLVPLATPTSGTREPSGHRSAGRLGQPGFDSALWEAPTA